MSEPNPEERVYKYRCRACGQRLQSFEPAPYPGRKHATPGDGWVFVLLCDSEDLEPIDD